MGGLNNPNLAKAMFYRGVAYRKQKMPAAALSDLNAAVWLRDGLSATDKAVCRGFTGRPFCARWQRSMALQRPRQ